MPPLRFLLWGVLELFVHCIQLLLNAIELGLGLAPDASKGEGHLCEPQGLIILRARDGRVVVGIRECGTHIEAPVSNFYAQAASYPEGVSREGGRHFSTPIR